MEVRVHSSEIKWSGTRDKQTIDWGLKTLKVYDTWKETEGQGVKVAVLDTGCIGHPDLKINLKGGINFSSDDANDFEDRAGHGTHVAGIIAAENNAFGVVGVAPKASVYAIKVLGDNGSGSYEMIAKGIDWAIENKMDIISMSLGSNYDSPILHDAIKKAYAKNITIVAAAGNDGDTYDDDDIDYPGKYEEVICVGAINKYLERSWFSSDGDALDVAAPGEDIYSTHLNNEYAILSGTSMATPFVTGVLALMISKHKNSEHNNTPINTPARIREHLLRTADDAGEIGRDRFYGYGIVNPKKLLEGIDVSQLYIV